MCKSFMKYGQVCETIFNNQQGQTEDHPTVKKRNSASLFASLQPAISFQTELEWDEFEWIVSSRIILNYREGYDIIRQFPERRSGLFSERLINLIEAESELHNRSILDTLSNL
jgi:hypothetical protein